MAFERREQESLREQPLGELIKDLSAELNTLVRQELDLAKLEMAQKGKQAAVAGGMFGGAGAVAVLGLGALTACVIAALATGMAVWLAALIVTLVYGLASGGLALVGRARIREAGTPVPEQTIESIKEDVQWAKTLKPSAQR